MSDDLQAHLAGGVTTVARAWAVARRDGPVLGFTDHDRALRFDGVDFAADAGLTARAFEQATGLSVDNTEAAGVLSAEAITEADIAAGRYDGAEVTVWQVNWADVAQRRVIFRGHLGEVTRRGGGFTAELRGLADALNREQGRIYHPRCAAVLGDGQCRARLDQPGMATEAVIASVEGNRIIELDELGGFDDGWFTGGRVEVVEGQAAGLSGLVRGDQRLPDGRHRLEMWQAIGAPLMAGERLRLWPGCDKSAETCRLKFNNFMNFRGFPHIPGEDWLMASPAQAPDRARGGA
ncbi:DUF2163 domain-containing protein [Paracoccus sp. p4-l81]|uniref:DUF2163 domain-containing protein n=1 Tax=unclassified Paracoccus (in: a-proteobacteria) TaxID=2688777 RepID=UPI0035B83834